MILKNRLCISLCLSAILLLVAVAGAQTRSRIVTTPESQPTSVQNSTDRLKRTVLSSPVTTVSSRPTLTNQIIVVGQPNAQKPLVKNTASTQPTSSLQPTNSMLMSNPRLSYAPTTNQRLLESIQSKLGIPYLYGSTGPNRYDCSGFVWSVFRDAGMPFTRASARSLWSTFEPVYGDDRFKFGTLVFFNKLGHMGIVADENGFYQASSSKGITYSPFKGYWEKRIVGFRRIPADYAMVK
ncbi:MAG: C40 family peptidase [Acidobacteria bacterium]|nr:C40 family peptidase [Acidobacteriota bacterium]